jgi:hypothetical protein
MAIMKIRYLHLVALLFCALFPVEPILADDEQQSRSNGTLVKNGWVTVNSFIRNCTFREQRRHAMLVRAPDGIIEGNTVDSVGGSGVYMANLIGSFHEGPAPQNCIIRDNVFRNTPGVAIIVGSQRVSSPAAYAKIIRITGNRIEGLSTPCIQAFSVSGLDISGNKLSLSAAASADAVLLSLTNTVNETVSGNSRQ